MKKKGNRKKRERCYACKRPLVPDEKARELLDLVLDTVEIYEQCCGGKRVVALTFATGIVHAIAGADDESGCLDEIVGYMRGASDEDFGAKASPPSSIH